MGGRCNCNLRGCWVRRVGAIDVRIEASQNEMQEDYNSVISIVHSPAVEVLVVPAPVLVVGSVLVRCCKKVYSMRTRSNIHMFVR